MADATSAPGPGASMERLRTGTGLTAAMSVFRLGPPLPHPGLGLTTATSAPGLGPARATSAPGLGLTGAKIEAFGCCFVEVMKPDDSSDVRARRSGVLTVCRGPTRCDIRSLPCLLPGCKTDHGQVPEGHCRPMRDGGTDDCADCGLDRERSEYGKSDEQLAGCAHSTARGTAVPRAAGQTAPTQVPVGSRLAYASDVAGLEQMRLSILLSCAVGLAERSRRLPASPHGPVQVQMWQGDHSCDGADVPPFRQYLSVPLAKAQSGCALGSCTPSACFCLTDWPLRRHFAAMRLGRPRDTLAVAWFH